jgi:ubiquinone/menaquinone biosynthesis C-methylase UbiE
MDRWKWFSLTRRYHVIDNPTSEAKIDQVVAALELKRDATVVDVACGNAEVLCRIAERYRARGTGIEVSPYRCEAARKKVSSRGLDSLVTVLEMRGQDFVAPDSSFDAALCIGATWVFGGYRGTLDTLRRWAKTGGIVVVGEPHWTAEPPPEYLASSGMKRESYGTHAGNLEIGTGLGLTPIFSVVSSPDDWDRYEGLSWLAAARYVRENPDDPDRAEIAASIARWREEYVRWGRNCFNWAIYLFEKSG